MVVKLFVEGGGKHHDLRTECRRGFSEFLKKAGLVENMPRIVACGSRQEAYDSFCTALSQGTQALLLVDSEAPVGDDCMAGSPEEWKPWQHLRSRSGDCWEKTAQANDRNCHLMVQCMEAWLLCDRKALATFFAQGFHANALPSVGHAIESVEKATLYRSLKNATKSCKSKGEYGKGQHSFKILAIIDPLLVVSASPWAKRFIDGVSNTMNY